MSDAFQRTQLRRYEKSIGEFKQLHHKIDWKTVKWIDSWYHPQRLNYLLSLRFWSFFTEYKIEASFSYSLLCYIYTNRTCLIFLSSLLILPSYSCSSLYICFKLWLKLNGISKKSSLWTWITHFFKYWLHYYYIVHSRWYLNWTWIYGLNISILNP